MNVVSLKYLVGKNQDNGFRWIQIVGHYVISVSSTFICSVAVCEVLNQSSHFLLFCYIICNPLSTLLTHIQIARKFEGRQCFFFVTFSLSIL